MKKWTAIVAAMALALCIMGLSVTAQTIESGAKVYPVEDTNIRKDSVSGTPQNGEKALVQYNYTNPGGWQRYYFMKYDLNGLDPSQTLDSVRLTMSNASGGAGTVMYGIYLIEDASWNEETANYNQLRADGIMDLYDREIFNVDTETVQFCRAAGNGVSQTVEITNLLKLKGVENWADKRFTIVVRQVSTLLDANGKDNFCRYIYTKDAADQTKRPYMTVNYVNPYTDAPSDPIIEMVPQYPVADTNFRSESVDGVYGMEKDLLVQGNINDGGYQRYSFIKLDIGGLTGEVDTAKLKITSGTWGNPNPIVIIPDFYNNGWDEAMDSYSSYNPGWVAQKYMDGWSELAPLAKGGNTGFSDISDILRTAQKKGVKKLTLALRSSSATETQAIALHSKEAENDDDKPYFMVTYKAGETPEVPDYGKIYARRGTYTTSQTPNGNISNEGTYMVAGPTGYIRHAYLNFDLAGITQKVAKATLCFYGTADSGANAVLKVQKAKNWLPDTLTYPVSANSLFKDSDFLGQSRLFMSGNEFDVTGFVNEKMSTSETMNVVISGVSGPWVGSIYAADAADETVRPYLYIEYEKENEISLATVTCNGAAAGTFSAGTLAAAVEIKANKADARAAVIVAQYENGKLTGIALEEQTVAKGETGGVSASLEIKTAAGTAARVMVFDSLETLKPLQDAVILAGI